MNTLKKYIKFIALGLITSNSTFGMEEELVQSPLYLNIERKDKSKKDKSKKISLSSNGNYYRLADIKTDNNWETLSLGLLYKSLSNKKGNDIIFDEGNFFNHKCMIVSFKDLMKHIIECSGFSLNELSNKLFEKLTTINLMDAPVINNLDTLTELNLDSLKKLTIDINQNPYMSLGFIAKLNKKNTIITINGDLHVKILSTKTSDKLTRAEFLEFQMDLRYNMMTESSLSFVIPTTFLKHKEQSSLKTFGNDYFCGYMNTISSETIKKSGKPGEYFKKR